MAKSRILSLAFFLVVPLIASAQAPSNEWLTWGYDQSRTGWNKGEMTLSKDNVSKLELKWQTQLSTKPQQVVLSTLTAPLVVENVKTANGVKTFVFTLGSDDTLFAIDADTGKVAWQKTYTNEKPPLKPATLQCANTPQATPVIDGPNGIIYFTTSDGKLRGLNVADGAERLTPIDFITRNARSWSLNLIDGVIYTDVARGCAGAQATVASMDVSDLAHPKQVNGYTYPGTEGGPWGRGGPIRGPKGIYVTNADATYDPAAGKFGGSMVVFRLKTLQLADSFTPNNIDFINERDLDLGSASPVIFQFQKWTLVADAAKESAVYLLDANQIGGEGKEHNKPLVQLPRLGNDEASIDRLGVWGGSATYEDPQGQRFIYIPLWGPESKDYPVKFKYVNGPTPEGSVMAFQVGVQDDKLTLNPAWKSPDMHVPDAPVVANGVVFALETGENTKQRKSGTHGDHLVTFNAAERSVPYGNMVLHALDAETGKELYSSNKLMASWVHFSEPVVAAGRVFAVSWDAHLYCFGLKK